MTDGIRFTSTQEIVDQAHSETRELRKLLRASQEILDESSAEITRLRARIEMGKTLITSALTRLGEEREKSERIKTALINFSNETLQDEITGRQAVEAILLLCAEAEKPNA